MHVSMLDSIVQGCVVLILAGCLMGCPPTVASYSVSGRITTETGAGLSDVVVTVNRQHIIAFTNASGHWGVGDMDGWHEVVPVRDGYVFEPPSIPIGPTAPVVSNIDFTAIYRPYYPDTPDGPVLHFRWASDPPLELTGDDAGHIHTCVPFGYERGDSASRSPEFAFLLQHRRRDPIYALAPGTIVHRTEHDDFETAADPDQGGEIWIRYGRNYVLGYRHVVTQGTSQTLGDTVESGEIIGYTVDYGDGGSVYNVVLGRRRDGQYHYINPLRFFDPISQIQLVSLWNAAYDTEFAPYAAAVHPWGDITEILIEGQQNELREKGGL